MVKLRRIGRLGAAWAAALLAAPALAAAPPSPDLAAWLARNTDLVPSQVVIAGPDNIYSLEPLGPRSAAGEALALVRTEPLADDWGKAHGFQSWDANLLIDCAGHRLKVIRSASYPERNRQGAPTAGGSDNDWITPMAGDPAVNLVAAACDPAFAWPLRVAAGPAPTPPKLAAAPPAPAVIVEARPVVRVIAEARPFPALPGLEPKPPAAPPIVETRPVVRMIAEAQPFPALPAIAPKPATVVAAPAALPPSDPHFVQLARGPSEEGARRALEKARKVLGPLAAGLTDSTETTELGRHHRYTARLQGFPTAAAAEAACGKLTAAGQSCFVRPAPAALLSSATEGPAKSH